MPPSPPRSELRSTRGRLRAGSRCSSVIPPIAAIRHHHRDRRCRLGPPVARSRVPVRVTLGVGLLDLAGRAFRIAHMGHVSAASILGVLGVVEAALLAIDAPIGGSGVAAAARSVSQTL